LSCLSNSRPFLRPQSPRFVQNAFQTLIRTARRAAGDRVEALGRSTAGARIDHLQQKSVAAYPTILSRRSGSCHINWLPATLHGVKTPNRSSSNLRSATLKS
jgi:hypothetical protein